MSALPIMIGVLCVLAIAYRYYSAFIAAKVLALDDSFGKPEVREALVVHALRVPEHGR